MIRKLKVLLKKVASNGYCKSLGLHQKLFRHKTEEFKEESFEVPSKL